MKETWWRERAACRDVDPELFFPVAEAGPVYDAQVAAAKAVCQRCPVRAECLVEALERMPHGVAGGLTEHERHGVARAGGRRTRAPGSRPDPRAQVAAGRSCAAVAAECGVSERTVQRWVRRGAA